MENCKRLDFAIEMANSATVKDNAGQYTEALALYKKCLTHFDLIRKYESNPLIKETVIGRMEGYITRAETIKKYLETVKDKDNHTPANERPDNETNRTADPESEEKEKFKTAISSAILMTKPNVKWSDVAGLDAAKDSIKEAVILPTQFPHLFEGDLKPWNGILLYGPPGTGKTHLAKACATEGDATFLSVSSSDMLSKWQGDSEKLVRALFDLARQHSPSIIFIDEVDSLCTARNSQESESSRRIKTEFLVQMQGLATESNSRILVLGATNLPWELDGGILRRFERRVYIPLPDATARKKMFELNVTATPHVLTSADFMQLANASQGYSGADIAIVCRDALFQRVRKCTIATHFKRVKKDGKLFWIPCSPGDRDPTKEERSLGSIPGKELIAPELNMYDFESALDNARPSVGQQVLTHHEEWTRKYGVDGSL